MATDLGLLIGVIGIRTKATKSSDAAWDAGHRAAVPLMRWTTWFGVLMTVVTVVAVSVQRPGEDPGWEVVAPILGFVGVVVGLMVAGVVADRAAKTVG